MTDTTTLSYDPYDVAVNADPYPVFRRLREEAPLYYNAECDFCAVSRYDDVEGRIALDELLDRFPEWDVDLTAPTPTCRVGCPSRAPRSATVARALGDPLDGAAVYPTGKSK